jgi:hypothetical protein
LAISCLGQAPVSAKIGSVHLMSFWKDRWDDIRGSLLWQVIIWICGGGLVTAVAQILAAIRDHPLALKDALLVFVISALALAVAFLLAAARRNAAIPQAQGSHTTALEQLKNADDFYRTYDNALLVEAETNIRSQANQYKSPDDREKFLTRTLASTFIVVVFENDWHTIFGSQLRLLEELNSQPVTIEEIRNNHYQHAVEKFPAVYSNYSFESWIGFLHANVLTAQHGNTVSITVRGREFLKYLIHQGRATKTKAF